MNHINKWALISAISWGLLPKAAQAQCAAGFPVGGITFNSANQSLEVCTTTGVAGIGGWLNNGTPSTPATFTYTPLNVGIGTANPSNTLQVVSPSTNSYVGISAPIASQSAISFQDASNGQDWVLYRFQGTRDLSLWNPTVGTSMYWSQSNGNVGVGSTTSPGEKVDVEGSTVHNGIKIGNSGGDYLELFDDSNSHIEGKSGSTLWIDQDNSANTSIGWNGSEPTLWVQHSGNVGIGTMGPNYPLDVESAVAGSWPAVNYLYGGSQQSSFPAAVSSIPNVSIYTPNWIVAGAVGAWSDRRLKEQIQDISDDAALNFLKFSRPVHFRWKKDKAYSYGFIAQDIVKLGFRESVIATKDPTIKKTEDPDGFVSPEGEKFILSYDQLVAVLTKAVQLVNTKLDNFIHGQAETVRKIVADALPPVNDRIARQDREIQSLKAQNELMRTKIDTLDQEFALLKKKDDLYSDIKGYYCDHHWVSER